MKKILAALVCVSVLVSCQKEVSFEANGNTAGNGGSLPGGVQIEGVWNFVELREDATTELNAVIQGQSMKSITVSKFTTTDNSGTVEFDGNTMFMKGVGYSANYNATVTSYIGGLSMGSQPFPVSFLAPPQDYSLPYKKITADSIEVQVSGSDPFNIQSNLPTTTQSTQTVMNAKFTFVDDQLLMTIPVNSTQSISDLAGQQATGTVKATGVGIMVLKK